MIVLTDLQKVQDQTTIIDIPSLQVKEREIAALFGPVDSGKDVLFQLLIGSASPTRGSVHLAGVDPYRNRQAFSRIVGVMFAENTLYKRLTVIENLHFYCRLYRLPKTRAVEVLELVGLADQTGVRTEKLTSNLSRRLALGQAILNNPRVLLLAEPFAGCEQASIKLIVQVVRGQADSGTSVLLFSQDTAHLESFCDMVYHLDQGRIVEAYDPRQEQQRQRPFMVPARSNDKIVLVDPAEILFVYAQEDHTYLQTLNERLPTQFTLTELEKRLSLSGFFRAHRAYLVNLQQVKEVIPYTRDSFSLKLKDPAGTKVPLSKSSERELRELLGY
jgi:ABC-2 type transport system ATP-binding protein